MRRLVLVQLFLMTALAVSGQDVEWGETLSLRKSYDSYHHYDFRSSDRSFVIGITTDRWFKAYENDSNLRVIRSWEYRWEKGVGEVIIGLERYGDSLMIFVEESTPFGELTIKKVYIKTDYTYTSNRLATFDFRISEVPNLRLQKDKLHWYVWYSVDNNRFSDKKKIFCHSFDSNWVKERTDLVELPFRQREIDILDMDVERFGKYLVYAKTYNGNKLEKRGRQPNSMYSLLLIDRIEDSTKLEKIHLTTDSMYYGNMRFRRKGQSVYFYGTFSTRTDDDVEGFFAGKASLRNGHEVLRRTYLLPDSIRIPTHDLVIKGLAVKKLDHYYLSNYSDYEGKLTFVLEKRYATASGMSGGRTLYEYHYRDLIVGQIDQEGLYWVVKIKKYQKTFNDKGRFSSFAMITRNDSIKLFFNDHYGKGNFANRKLTNPNRFTLVNVNVSSDGHVYRQIITDHTRFKYPLTISKLKYVGNGKYLCYGQNRKTVQACFIRLN